MKNILTMTVAFFVIAVLALVANNRGLDAEHIAFIFFGIASAICLPFIAGKKDMLENNFLTNFNQKMMYNSMKRKSLHQQHSGLVIRARSKRGK